MLVQSRQTTGEDSGLRKEMVVDAEMAAVCSSRLTMRSVINCNFVVLNVLILKA